MQINPTAIYHLIYFYIILLKMIFFLFLKSSNCFESTEENLYIITEARFKHASAV